MRDFRFFTFKTCERGDPFIGRHSTNEFNRFRSDTPRRNSVRENRFRLILKNKMQREDSLPVFSADEDKSIDHEGKYYVIVLAINGLRYVHIRVHIK